MDLTSWIEAIKSGGAKEHKQKALCIFCQYYPVSWVVYHEWYTPSTPNFEVFTLPCAANFMKIVTSRSYRANFKHLSKNTVFNK